MEPEPYLNRQVQSFLLLFNVTVPFLSRSPKFFLYFNFGTRFVYVRVFLKSSMQYHSFYEKLVVSNSSKLQVMSNIYIYIYITEET
jgi:hypothetical protein